MLTHSMVIIASGQEIIFREISTNEELLKIKIDCEIDQVIFPAFPRFEGRLWFQVEDALYLIDFLSPQVEIGKVVMPPSGSLKAIKSSDACIPNGVMGSKPLMVSRPIGGSNEEMRIFAIFETDGKKNPQMDSVKTPNDPRIRPELPLPSIIREMGDGLHIAWAGSRIHADKSKPMGKVVFFKEEKKDGRWVPADLDVGNLKSFLK